jgi:hypothetical protein
MRAPGSNPVQAGSRIPVLRIPHEGNCPRLLFS